jgi:hypothetical protein
VENPIQHPAYSKRAIEFVAVATESCSFFEHVNDFEKQEFLDRIAKLLSIIYLKASMLEELHSFYEEELECFVTEQDYEYVRENSANLLGVSDSYLEVFHPDIQLSDTPIAARISENIADIYQELKDFSLRYQMGNNEIMSDALFYCKQSFKEHWGQKLLNALKAIHAVLYTEQFFEEDENEFLLTKKTDRESLLNNLRNQEQEGYENFFEK